MSSENALTTEQQKVELVKAEVALFDHKWKIANGYSRSELVPTHLRGKPHDCLILAELAERLKVAPLMVMQNVAVVHGKPTFEAKLAVALLNSSGKIRGTLKHTFEGSGDDYGCRAWAIDAETGEKVIGPKVDWKIVKAEGWNKDKAGQKSKWSTMPEIMFTYRAASFFIKANYPEVLMGMQTTEEMLDAIDVESRPVPSPAASSLNAALGLGEVAPQPPAIETVIEPDEPEDDASETQDEQGDLGWGPET